MVTVRIRFVAGKYCADAWGTGGPEWPPSPHRLLRGMIAAWKYNTQGIDEGSVLDIMHGLASRPPWMRLPQGVTARVGSRGHFVEVGGAVSFWWPKTTVDADILTAMLGNMHYLGRTESWCQATTARWARPNCIPLVESRGDYPHHITEVRVPQRDISLDDLYAIQGTRRKAEGIYPDMSVGVPYAIHADCAI